jgi:hypothetical protein
MDVLHPRCCGSDVHKRSISACILLREAGRVQKHQRRFGAMTQELEELAEWLRQFGVTQVAMESGGVYWILRLPEKVTESGQVCTCVYCYGLFPWKVSPAPARESSTVHQALSPPEGVECAPFREL